MDTPTEWLWMKKGVRIYHNGLSKNGYIVSLPYWDTFSDGWYIWVQFDGDTFRYKAVPEYLEPSQRRLI